MKDHVGKVHEGKRKAESKDNDKKFEKRLRFDIPCNQCNKTFANETYLKRHLEIHPRVSNQ